MVYHIAMMVMGDVDPSYPALEYIADRFELNIEQRLWISFLYQSCYTASTVFYIYNEFPDYENVDVRRLEWWWGNNKHKLFFQTDRAKVKNFNKFVPMFQSYRTLVGKSQKAWFDSMIQGTPQENYDRLYKECGKIYYIGRFSLFLYLESLHRLTKLDIQPTGLDFKNAESCANGLCYALGWDDLVGLPFQPQHIKNLTYELDKLMKDLQLGELLPIDYWCVETSLCAYKKLYWNKRYLGYYIDRLQTELLLMEKNVPEGVDWSVLWDFRKEYFDHRWLGELQGWTGVRKHMMGLPSKEYLLQVLQGQYKKRVEFERVWSVYDY